MQEVNEQILTSWLMMIMAVDSERVPTQLPYNEAVVCNLLYTHPNHKMTATELCSMTKMMKSQMNRTLTSLENKKLIERIRSSEDKRSIIIRLVDQEDSAYIRQHQKTLKYVDELLSQVGYEKANDIIQLFTSIANNANKK
ncbi:MAG: MarR family winged helix-turn-helix transcriptional regulator [Traorella sp.]